MRQASKKKRKKKSKAVVASHFQRLVREGMLIFALAISAFLMLALLTYHRTDPGWSRVSSSAHILNSAGRVGAWFSDIFLYLFGYMAYLFPVLLGIGAAVVYRNHRDGEMFNALLFIFRVAGLMFILFGGTGFASLHFYHWGHYVPFDSGGILGELIAGALVHTFNYVGSSVLLGALFLVGVTLFTGLSWLTVSEWIGRTSVSMLLMGYDRAMPFIQEIPQQIKRLIAARKKIPRIDKYISRDQLVRQNTLKEKKVIEKPLSTTSSADTKPVITKPSTTQYSQRYADELQLKLIKTPKGKAALPPLNLLDMPEKNPEQQLSEDYLEHMSRLVESKLLDFGIEVQVVAVHPGPVITRYELQLAPGQKVNKITNLVKDLARSLSAVSVRIVEVIPGKSVVGLEIPNDNRDVVRLTEVLASKQYEQARSTLSLALGKDIAGHPVVVDLAKMPHLLIAGTTGSGKSVGINAMILSLLYRATPEDVRLIMVDPKMLELSIYDGIPHLLTPVVTDMKEATNALRWCVAEMERRYRLMAALGVRNLSGYNHKVREAIKQKQPLTDPLAPPTDENPDLLKPLPFIVVLIDELADMMMVVGKKVEELIARIAQKARAAGIHLVLATQRPSVDVITGLIKANVPTRISFQVSSKIDSRTILDQQGAEQLLGHGDMLYLPPGSGLPVRVHGAFVADSEVHSVVSYLKQQYEPEYLDEVTQAQNEKVSESQWLSEMSSEDVDELYQDAVRIVLETRRASISSIQRRLKIGFNRAARLIEEMEKAGIVGPMESSGNREVLAPPLED